MSKFYPFLFLCLLDLRFYILRFISYIVGRPIGLKVLEKPLNLSLSVMLIFSFWMRLISNLSDNVYLVDFNLLDRFLLKKLPCNRK